MTISLPWPESKTRQLVMLKHCVDDEGLLILQRLNFPEDDCANNMQSKLEKLEMYCSKQTKHLFEHFKLRQKH